MIPLSSSFTHATHKLSPAARAAVTALQNMPLPPPAYTANAHPRLETPASDIDSDSDASEWTSPHVTIHINASIAIEGTSNQVALPPHPSSRPLRVIGDNLRAVQGSLLDYLGSPASADRLACDRAEQISDAVMQALKDSGVFAGTVTPMRRLDVSVDASVCVKGERNVLTTNVPLRRNGSGTTATPTPETPCPTPLRIVDGPGAERESRSSALSRPAASGTSTGEHDANGDLAQGPSATQDGRTAGEPMPTDVDTQNQDGSRPEAEQWKAPMPKLASPTQHKGPSSDSGGMRRSMPYPEGEVPGVPSMKRKRTAISTSTSGGGEDDGGREKRVDI